MSSLQEIVEQLLFGSEDEPGGIMKAVGLDEGHVVYELDPGERPDHPFMSFAFPAPASDVLYGPPHNEYITAEADPDDDSRAILRWNNARRLGVRLYFYGLAGDQTYWDIYAKAQAAREYLNTQANRDLTLAGYGGEVHVESPGTIRDASTVFNAQSEIRLALDTALIVGEAYDVSVEAIEKLGMTFTMGAEPEGAEEEIEL